ncbi:MAG: NAD(P)/FAD-dependent oxidoreductase [Burkholderiales bacterium]|nr:NAD(P)/FAD-dependent oxidoreductase [Burkholderiales bacterium]
MDQVDALVIGAGVVGLAVGAELARHGRETVVVEAESGIGQGVSSRNSEVIHAGIYYAAGSAKARLCVRGKELLYAFCAAHGVPHRRCGKLIVATGAEQHAALAALAQRAAAAGVPLEPMTAPQARAIEPELCCTAALLSASSGIVDSHALMLALQGELEGAGGALALQTQVRAVRFAAGAPAVVRASTPEGEYELAAGCVVNATGLHAPLLARHFAGLPAEAVPRARFAKGSYFALTTSPPPFSHLIYPVPVDAWLGVHVTLDLAGQLRFGPDHEWLEVEEPGRIDYAVQLRRAEGFEVAIRRYWPGLPAGALAPAYSGVRPKIHGPGQPAPDFRIDGPRSHGVAGLVNLFGIESPGLTASLALAEEVRSLLA